MDGWLAGWLAGWLFPPRPPFRTGCGRWSPCNLRIDRSLADELQMSILSSPRYIGILDCFSHCAGCQSFSDGAVICPVPGSLSPRDRVVGALDVRALLAPYLVRAELYIEGVVESHTRLVIYSLSAFFTFSRTSSRIRVHRHRSLVA